MAQYDMSKAADEAGLDYETVAAKALEIAPGARIETVYADLESGNRSAQDAILAAIEQLTAEAQRAESGLVTCEWGHGRSGWLVSSAEDLSHGQHVWVVRRDGSQQDVWIDERVEEGRRGRLYSYREFDFTAAE